MDGGLHIERFSPEKQPGVQVKRIVQTTNQPDVDVYEVMNYYKQALAEVGGESPGTWTGSHALALSDRQILVSSFTFKVIFTIQHLGEPQPGLSLDPLMRDPVSGKYYTEIPVEEKPYYRHIRDFLMTNLALL